jgi:hypothetical protein
LREMNATDKKIFLVKMYKQKKERKKRDVAVCWFAVGTCLAVV